MTVDQLGVADFVRQKIGCPTLIILVHEKQDTVALDPAGNVLFIVFDVVVETVLFHDRNVKIFQILRL